MGGRSPVLSALGAAPFGSARWRVMRHGGMPAHGRTLKHALYDSMSMAMTLATRRAGTGCFGGPLLAILLLLQPADAASLGTAGDTGIAVRASTGQAGLNVIGLHPSMNDDGDLAFVATDGSGQGVFFVPGPAGTAPVRVSVAGSATYGSELQINNAQQIGVVSVVGAQRRARIYTAPAGGSLVIASSSIPRSTTSHFDALGNFVSLSNDGRLAFLGLESPVSGDSFWELHLSDTEVDRRDFFSLLSEVAEFPIPPDLFGRQWAADGERVVFGVRRGDIEDITWHSIAGLLGTSVSVATTANGRWSGLGVRPGMSDDGKVVVFCGTLTAAGAAALTVAQPALPPLNAGLGVFAAILNAGGDGFQFLRLAGLAANGFLEPGENWTDTDSDGVVDATEDGAGFTAFDLDARLAVERTPPGTHRFAFLGTGPGTLVGLYSGRFDAAKFAIKALPTAVALVTRELPGVAQTLTAVSIHDAVNASNQLAFRFQTATDSQVAVATRRLDPHRQFQAPWGTNLYAPDQLDEFIERLENGGPNIVAADVAELNRLREVRDDRALSLARRGCLITSYAMALRHLGLADVTPSELNDQLLENAGISDIRYLRRNDDGTLKLSSGLPTFKGADLQHTVMETLYPELETVERTGAPQDVLDAVVAHLQQGRPALLNVRAGGHWILASRLENNRLTLIDPGSSFKDGPYLNDLTSITNAAAFGPLLKARLLSRRTNPTAIVQTQSPVHFLITDPSGHRLGYDPATGIRYAEIAGSSYSDVFPIGDPEESYTAEDRADFEADAPRVAFLNDVEAGTYLVEVVGTGDGPFTLSFRAFSAGVPVSYQQSGNITSGSRVQFQFPVALNGPPVAGNDPITRFPQLAPLKIAIADLLANDSDPEDGAGIVFDGLPSHVSAAGAMLSVVGDRWIVYSPSLRDADPDDTWSYRIRDSKGATAIATVTVSEVEDARQLGTLEATVVGGADVLLSFRAIPGRTYQVQSTDQLQGAATIWTAVGSATSAASDGLIEVTDVNGAIGSARFYRAIDVAP